MESAILMDCMYNTQSRNSFKPFQGDGKLNRISGSTDQEDKFFDLVCIGNPLYLGPLSPLWMTYGTQEGRLW